MMDLDALGASLEQISSACRRVRPASFGVPFCPVTPTDPQRRFLACQAREVFYGGAAGGGKSAALLMRSLLYTDRPSYRALVLRRSFADLSQPGALMDLAASWLGSSGAEWHGLTKSWTFPSGARLVFGYADNIASIERVYQGAAYHTISIDELGQWREAEYRYLFSRVRKTAGDDVPLGMRGGGNPGGIGHDWVKARFVDGGNPERVFIPAKLSDNPHLDQASYRANLAELDDVKRRQLEDGEWVDTSGELVYPLSGEVNGRVYSAVGDWDWAGAVKDEWHFVLAIDLGSSASKPSTAYVLLAYSDHSREVWALRSWTRAGESPHSIADEIAVVRESVPLERCVLDTGGLGEGYRRDFIARFGEWFDAAEKKDKLGQRHILRGCLERGELRIDRAAAGLIAECGSVRWDAERRDVDESTPDHITDALLYGNRYCRGYLARPKKAREEKTEEAAMMQARIAEMEGRSWKR